MNCRVKRIKIIWFYITPKVIVVNCVLFVGNMRRREDIRRFWYFDCECPRCSDPTELGSYMSAVICFACKRGFLVPIDSLQYKSDWKCDSCGHIISYDLVNEVISTIESQVSSQTTITSTCQLEWFLSS